MYWQGFDYSSTDLHLRLIHELEGFQRSPYNWAIQDPYTRGQIFLATQIQQFVNAVCSTMEDGFVEVKTPFINTAKKWNATELGQNFYPLILGFMTLHCPRLRLAPEVNQFHETCFTAGLATFAWPADPEAEIVWIQPTVGMAKFHGRVQGAQVFNDLVHRLRLAVSSPRFRNTVLARQNHAIERCESVLAYETALFEDVKALQAVSLDLGYRSNQSDEVPLQMAQDHIARIVGGSPKSIFADQCGYVRKLEYWKRAYRFRVVLFFRNQNVPAEERAEKIGQHWNKTVTGGIGMYLGTQNRDISTPSPNIFSNDAKSYDREKVRRTLANFCLYENLLQVALDPTKVGEKAQERLKTITRGEMPARKRQRITDN